MAETRSWVDLTSDACSLPTAQKPLRLAEFDTAFDAETVAVDRLSPTTASFVLRSEPGVAGRMADLAAREADCCSFFEFSLSISAGRLALVVEVPSARVDVLDALVERARTRQGDQSR